jgi:F-type H+-transporting ATPase subunit epsilon
MHAPLMTLLGRGILRVDTAGGEQRFQVDGGFLQVVDDAVRVVTEQASAV